MKIAGIREIRSNTAALLGGHDPVLVTRHGKISGLYLPLETPGEIPDDLSAEITRTLGSHLSQLLDAQGISENEIEDDFNDFRRGRR